MPYIYIFINLHWLVKNVCNGPFDIMGLTLHLWGSSTLGSGGNPSHVEVVLSTLSFEHHCHSLPMSLFFYFFITHSIPPPSVEIYSLLSSKLSRHPFPCIMCLACSIVDESYGWIINLK